MGFLSLQEDQATGNLKQCFNNNNNNNEKKIHCHSLVGGGFYQSGELSNSLFNKSSGLRGRRRAQKSFTFYKCLSSIIHNIIHYPGVCFRVMLLHLLPYNFLEIKHLQIYIHSNQSNIEKLGNN